MTGGKHRIKRRRSIILNALDRFALLIYSWLKNGFFGRIFTSYKPCQTVSRSDSRFAKIFRKFRTVASSAIQKSRMVSSASRFTEFFLKLKLRVYGTFLASFGTYSAAVYLISVYAAGQERRFTDLVSGVFLMIVSIPLVVSKKTLSEALLYSQSGAYIRSLTGSRTKAVHVTGRAGHVNFAFIAGIAAGVVSYVISPIRIAAVLIFIACALIILSTPEVGVVLTFLLVPFVPNHALYALIALCAFSLIVKLIRAKRFIALERLDISVIVIAAVLLLSGVASIAPGGFTESVKYLCMIAGYFLTVSLINDRIWLDRCSLALIISGTAAASVHIVFASVAFLSGSPAALSSSYGSGLLYGFAFSDDRTLVSILFMIVLLLSAGKLITGQGRRFPLIYSVLACAGGLILTGNILALGAFLIALIVFILTASRRGIYIILISALGAGAAYFPLLRMFPEFFGGISSAISQTLSRNYGIQSGSVSLIEKSFFSGIGFGSSWSDIYPAYAGQAADSAAHSYNTYYQLIIGTGIGGLLLFCLFIFLLIQSNYTLYKRLDNHQSALGTKTYSPSKSLYYSPLEELAGDKYGSQSSALRAGHIASAMRIGAAAPMCSVLAVCLCGFSDFVFFDRGVFLLFCLVCALSSAQVRVSRRELDWAIGAQLRITDTPHFAKLELPLASRSKHKKRS